MLHTARTLQAHLGEGGEHVRLAHDDVVLLIVALKLCAGVLGVHHLRAHLQVQGLNLVVLADRAGAHCHHLVVNPPPPLLGIDADVAPLTNLSPPENLTPPRILDDAC
eukprot:1185380-Prorocentrum_minimum.AAC.2